MDEHDDRADFSVYSTDPPQQSQDAVAILRNELDAAFGDGAELTRDTALQLLRIFSETLGPSLRVICGDVAPGEIIVADHPGIILLNELRNAIADLETAKVHPALAPATCGANASLTIKQQLDDRSLVELVVVMTQPYGEFKTQSAARKFLERKFRSRGKKRKGEVITALLLKSLWDRSELRQEIKRLKERLLKERNAHK